MGCVCCSLSSFVSILLHALERITLCTVCAALVCCLLFTIMIVLVMGIGIGFHYCTVQNSVDAMRKAAQAAGALRSGGGPSENGMMRSVQKAVKRGFAHRLGKRDKSDEEMPSNNNTINDIILFGQNNKTNDDLPLLEQNVTVPVASRVKRNLAAGNHLDDFLTPNNTVNDIFNVTVNNETLVYSDETEIKFSDGTGDGPVRNYTLHDIMLLRQNCTLLNFFTRFF